jgi:membrane-bound metal-dependent hydrolase YbcI (DUF457 family)
MVSQSYDKASPLCSFPNLFCTSFITLCTHFLVSVTLIYPTSLVVVTNLIVRVYVYPNEPMSNQSHATELLIRIVVLQNFSQECSVLL